MNSTKKVLAEGDRYAYLGNYVRVYVSLKADTEDLGVWDYFWLRPSEPTTCGANDAQRSEKLFRDNVPN